MCTRIAYRVLIPALFACLAATPDAALANPAPLPVMYVSDYSSTINVFRLDNGQELGSIPYPMAPGGTGFGGGVGVATDRQNNLYAGYLFDNGNNYPGKSVVFKYAPGEIHWSTKIAGGCCSVPNLAVSNRGEIAEALEETASCCYGGVGFIEPGKKFVERFNGTLSSAYAEAYDATGALWVDGADQNFNIRFGYFRPGSNSLHEVALSPKPHLGPLAVDASNDVLVENGSRLYAYNRSGTLVYSVALAGAANAIGIALSRDASMLYVAESSGNVLAYAFPGGGAPVVTYAVGGSPFAIALGSI